MDAGIIDAMAENMRNRMLTVGDSVVKYSLASLVGLLTLAVYLVLVPLMVFFLLKDKEQMLNAVRRVLPRNRGLAGQVWKEMNQQITNYIRGKVLEMIVVSVATWIGFILFGLNYSLLLAVLVGFSVLIPYIGAFVVTIPVVGVALFQFGAGTEFWSLFAVYLIIQGAGRQPAGPGAVLGSGQFTPAGDYPVGGDLWRAVGVLGRLLRHSAGHAD